MSDVMRAHYEMTLPKMQHPAIGCTFFSLRVFVSDSFGRSHIRYPKRGEPIRAAMLRIGHAIAEANVTDRPAFREVADNLRWDEIR